MDKSKKPIPPICRICREGHTCICKLCGSTLYHKFMFFCGHVRQSKGCIQEECLNYWMWKIYSADTIIALQENVHLSNQIGKYLMANKKTKKIPNKFKGKTTEELYSLPWAEYDDVLSFFSKYPSLIIIVMTSMLRDKNLHWKIVKLEDGKIMFLTSTVDPHNMDERICLGYDGSFKKDHADKDKK